MCEMLAVTAPLDGDPLDMAAVLEWACLMDERGIAGYGWGIVWWQEDGLHRYRQVLGIRQDPAGLKTVSRVKTHRLMLHVRRPSLMSTISQVDTQPYLDPEAGWAFAHNGYLERHQEFRARYGEQLIGRSDSEVGFRMWLDTMRRGEPASAALRSMHEQVGGQANFMALSRDGALLVYAGNVENACYRFRLGNWSVAATGLHSHDAYLFETIFPDAVGIERLGAATVLELP
jgi:predicted glutamine amidotransferase